MISKKWRWCLAAIGFVVITGMALPQSKKDFEKAAQETIGCGLIPYERLHDSCRGAYSRQREWCTGEREKGCADLPKDQKDEARKRRDNADECLKYRKEVRQVYSEAIDRLKGEKQDDIRPLAEEIIKRIEATFPNHDSEIEKTERRGRTCNDLL
jgi:hypothetical protein